MKPASAKTLVGAAVASVFLGMLVMSPHGSLFLYGLAAILAGAPTIFSRNKLRIVSGVVLAASLALAVNVYPDYANYLRGIHGVRDVETSRF